MCSYVSFRLPLIASFDGFIFSGIIFARFPRVQCLGDSYEMYLLDRGSRDGHLNLLHDDFGSGLVHNYLMRNHLRYGRNWSYKLVLLDEDDDSGVHRDKGRLELLELVVQQPWPERTRQLVDYLLGDKTLSCIWICCAAVVIIVF